jgi:hypothetical protein
MDYCQNIKLELVAMGLLRCCRYLCCPAGHVIPGLVHKCYLAQQKGEPFTIMGSGKPL